MRVSDTAIGVAAILFGSWVIGYARNFPKLEKGYPGPSLFPTVLAVLFIVAGIVLIFQDLRSKKKILKFDISHLSREHLANLGLILAAVLFYIFLSNFLGFQIISFVILIVLMKRLRVSNAWCLIMAFGMTVAIHLLFAKVLLVPLPWGLWGW